MSGNIEGDLNETIRSAVNARVEAEVTKALAGDEVIGALVTAALQQTVEVPARGGGYGKEKVPFMTQVVRKAIQGATQAAVAKVIEQEAPLIEEEVRKAFKRNAGAMAEGMVASLSERAASNYGVTVELKLPNKDY
jgi:hypothetical protein